MSEQLSRFQRFARSFAWGALIVSFPVWGAALTAPFLPLPAGQRALFAGVCIAVGELMFWGAGLYLGAEVIARFRPRKVTTGESYRGKRIIVIGATGGLGEAVARAVYREGGALVAIGRDESRLRALAHSISETAPQPDQAAIEVVVSDLSPAALRQAAVRAGPIDAVVCMTGVDVRKRFVAHDDQDIARSVDVDLLGPIHVAHAFLPQLRTRGVIALCGGFADGSVALPYYSVDVAARAGLAGFCKALNRELELEGQSQRLCYVCPAPAETEAEAEAEQRYLELWRSLGVKVVSPSAVADFVLSAVLAQKTVAVMGFSTRLLARVEGALPWLGHVLVLRLFGAALRARFSVVEEPGHRSP